MEKGFFCRLFKKNGKKKSKDKNSDVSLIWFDKNSEDN